MDIRIHVKNTTRKFNGDSDRVAFLFTLYQQLSSPLAVLAAKPMRRRKSQALQVTS